MDDQMLDENGNIIEIENQSKKQVFEFDSDELYELFAKHGVKERIREVLRKCALNGRLFHEWREFKNFNGLKEFLDKKYETLHTNLNLTELEARHLFSILAKYIVYPYKSNSKLIGDNVHGQITIHPLLIKIIDTPQFQRLRYIKQLGTLCYVYPTGNHSRFEHSIGTSHIAGLLIKHFTESQPGLCITLADELCVKIAGLCHDLGHGPFSHMFEEVIEELCPETKWKHEMTTLMMFDKMLNENEHLKLEFESFGLFENDMQFIKDLIYAPSLKSPALSYSDELRQLESLTNRGIEKSYLFEIISNYRNGIDVDKFDYFDRDCMQMGFANNFNYKRYIACTRVIKNENDLNQICCRDKDIQDLYEMFHVRERLTRRAYKHETASSINQMIVEALVKADNYFKFSYMIETQNIHTFEKLNDAIFMQILYSDSQILDESRKILERVGKRQLYKYVGRTVLPDSHNTNDTKKYLRLDLINYLEQGGVKSDNSVVELVKFNYGSGNKNPLENVRCYNKYSPNRAFKIEKKQISGMLLNQFEDVEIRVYLKKVEDYNFFDKVHGLFYTWCKSKDLPSPLYGIRLE